MLRTKGLEGFVSGEAEEPGDKKTSEWRTWSSTNSLIVAWLLNSLSPTIAATVETISTATEVWKTLSKLYSGEGNVMLIAETEERVGELRQGENSVMEYVAELQRLWADLDHYDPLDLPHADCIAAARKWIERRRVMQFLKGLNSEFKARRATLFHQPTLPALEDAITVMA
uniref:Retrotransposon gag domain-containing protein n=1 Tax=Triticum urartu TaxID=4572 RepID=A0A8R7Q9T4_TRIUA